MKAVLILFFVSVMAATANSQVPLSRRDSYGVLGGNGIGPAVQSYAKRPSLSYHGADSAPTVAKRFFTFTAVDNDDDDEDDLEDVRYSRAYGPRSYDVIFAHAPTQSPKSIARAFQQYIASEPSDVYSERRVRDIGGGLHSSRVKRDKPDVQFRKYKTADEADYIIQQIKAQYEALPGPNFEDGEQAVQVRSIVVPPGGRDIGDGLHSSRVKRDKPDVQYLKYKTPAEADYIIQQIRAQYEALPGPSFEGGEQAVQVRSVVVPQGNHQRRGNNPDVHFLKYKTPEEGAYIQKQIQAQYESLDGPTYYGGHESVPVRSVAVPSRFGFSQQESKLLPSSQYNQHKEAVPSQNYVPPRSKYLPPRH